MHRDLRPPSKNKSKPSFNVLQLNGNREMKNTSTNRKKISAAGCRGRKCLQFVWIGLLWPGIFFSCHLHLQAKGIDSLKVQQGLAIYRAAGQAYSARDWTEAFAKSGQAAQVFLEAGDTSKACAAMELQTNSYDGEGDRAIQILERAIDLYEEGLGDTSFIYFRLSLALMKQLRIRGHYPKAVSQAGRISGLEKRLLEIDRDKGMEAIFNFMIERAQISRDLGNLEQGIWELEQALAFNQDNPDCVRHRYVADAHSMLSQFYRRSKNTVLAREHHQYARDEISKIKDQTGIIEYTLLRYDADWAVILREARAYDEAQNILELTYSKAQSQSMVDEQLEAAIFANLGNVLMQTGKLDSAWLLTMKAKDIYSRDDLASNTLVAKMEITLATISRKMEKFVAGVDFAKQAAHHLSRRDAISMEDRAKAWTEAGRNYIGLGMQDSATICLLRLQLEQQEAESMIGTRCPEAWRGVAEIHGLLANFDSAEVCLRRALQACFVQGMYRGDPARIPFDQLLVESEYLTAMGELGKLQETRHRLTGCESYLAEALVHQLRAVILIAYLDAQRQNFGKAALSYDRLWRDHQWIIEGAIRCAFGMYRLHGDARFLCMALAVSELSKARQLGKRSIAADQSLVRLLDPKLHQQELELAMAIETDRRIAESAQRPDDPSARIARERLIANKITLTNLLQQIKTASPRYFDQKYGDQAQRQRVIAASHGLPLAGQARLEYFVGRDSLYAFFQTEDTLLAAVIPDRARLQQQVQAYLQAITHQASIEALEPAGKELSRALFPFPLPRKAVRQLTVVPDGFLYDLPFAALVWHGPLDVSAFAQRTPFWVYGVAMGRDFSLALHQAVAAEARHAAPSQGVVGFFPGVSYVPDSGGKALVRLRPHAALDALAGHADLRTYAGEQAHKRALLAALALPQVVEIKTHGLMDGDSIVSDAYLLMADSLGQANLLYASELYGAHALQPTLVVLNACVTAKGGFLPGEGAVTLARAFAMAGCRSVLANAWEASEAANDQLLATTYQGLAQGLGVAAALRQAQLAMLEGGQGVPRHPYYWACLELYGAGEEPLFQPRAARWPYVLVGLALFGWVALVVSRRVRRRV